jgi:hypothetical protein
MYANEINKIGDSYLPCIAMAHSPPSKILVNKSTLIILILQPK